MVFWAFFLSPTLAETNILKALHALYKNYVVTTCRKKRCSAAPRTEKPDDPLPLITDA